MMLYTWSCWVCGKAMSIFLILCILYFKCRENCSLLMASSMSYEKYIWLYKCHSRQVTKVSLPSKISSCRPFRVNPWAQPLILTTTGLFQSLTVALFQNAIWTESYAASCIRCALLRTLTSEMCLCYLSLLITFLFITRQ